MESRLRTERAAFALLLALAAAAGWAQQPTVIRLHYRSAESLITVLQPLVAPAVLTGAGERLQVSASRVDLPRVMHQIEQSDRPPRPLTIAFSDEPPTAEGVPAPPQDGSVTLSTGRAMPPDRYGNGQYLSTQPDEQPAAMLEGEPFRISMPATGSLWFGARGGRASPKAAPSGAGRVGSAVPDVGGVVHFDSVSDFTARIWLIDTTVAIELQPLAAGGVDAGTGGGAEHGMVYGRVGQWIALAYTGTDPGTAPNGSGAPRAGLWIRVDPASDPVGPR